MRIKAIISDLDNTIYSVPSIGNEMFAVVFQLILETGEHDKDIDAIRDEIMRKPFQTVAANYGFSRSLTEQGVALLQDLTYEGPITPFDDYKEFIKLPVEKFLVTTGFMNLQQSKVERMGLRKDFREIFIVDPVTTRQTKKDIFAGILTKYEYDVKEVLVVGDDADSEIKAGKELGIESILYDKFDLHPGYPSKKIFDFGQLRSFLE